MYVLPVGYKSTEKALEQYNILQTELQEGGAPDQIFQSMLVAAAFHKQSTEGRNLPPGESNTYSWHSLMNSAAFLFMEWREGGHPVFLDTLTLRSKSWETLKNIHIVFVEYRRWSKAHYCSCVSQSESTLSHDKSECQVIPAIKATLNKHTVVTPPRLSILSGSMSTLAVLYFHCNWISASSDTEVTTA